VFQTTKMYICGKVDVMHIHIRCSVYRRVIFLYKVTSSTTGLACIIQHF